MEVPPTPVSGLPIDLDYYSLKLGVKFDSVESLLEYLDDLDIDTSDLGIIREENNGIISNNSVIAVAGNNGTYYMVLSDDNGTMKNNLSIIMNEKNGIMTNNNTAMVVHQNNEVANNHGGIVMAENNRETRSVASIIPLSNPSNKHAEPVHNFSRENPAVVRWSREEESILMEKLAEYENEPILMKCIKIACILPGKSVRDIAKRCKWTVRDMRNVLMMLPEKYMRDIVMRCKRMEKEQTFEEHSAERISEGKKVPPTSVSGLPIDLDYYSLKLGVKFDSVESLLEYFDDLDIDTSDLRIIQEENNGIMSNNSVIAEAGNNGTYDMVLSDDNGTMKNNLSIIINEKNGMMTNNNTAMVLHQNNGTANNYGGIVMAENSKETRSVAPIIPLSNPSSKHVEPVHNFSRENPVIVRWSREERSILMEKLAEYENEPVLTKYARISVMLPGKSLRDILMMRKWMEKEQTSEEHSVKRISKKRKKVDTSQKTNDLPRQWKVKAANTKKDITGFSASDA